MSGGEAVGRVRVAIPEPVGNEYPIPLDPADGGVQAHIVGGAVIVIPTLEDIIYYTGTGVVGEQFSIIPPAPSPASLSMIYAHLIASAVAPRWIQLFQGLAAPPPGTKPLMVGDKITPIGGNTQFAFQNPISRALGYVVILSNARDTFVDPVAAELTTVAYGVP